jgi:peptide/nickel transport system substrate-binding protein
MKIRILAAAALAALAAGLTACAGTASAPSTAAGTKTIPLLRVGIPYAETSLDETKNIGADWVDGLALETLLTFGPQGQLEPALATSWAQTSPVTYVYHLRHGVKFWDGQPLTATDVAYSLNYDRAAASDVAFAFPGVKSIVATDPYTVTVTLAQPAASWKYTPAEESSYIFEKAFQQAHKATFGNPGTLVMGTGPWVVDSLDPTKGADLTANPHWWGGTAPIQHIALTIFASETSEALAFRAGEIDWAPQINNPQAFASASGAKLQTVPSCGNAFFGMNVTDPGWNDVHVRRAAAYALNRTDIIAANGGYAQPIYTLTPPSLLSAVASQSQINSLLSSLPLYQYNLAKAKQEMAQSAYPHGFAATVLTTNDSGSLNVSQVIAAELAKIGIRVQLKSVTSNAWIAVETGPAGKRMTSFSTGGCFNPDPSAYSDWLSSQNTQVGSWNYSDYKPASVDSLMAQGLAGATAAQRFAAYSDLFKQLQADEPYVGLFVSDAVMALSPKFTYPVFSGWIWNIDYALGIKPAS